MYAIEAGEHYKLAEEVVKQNNVEDIVTVIHGKAEDIELPGKADIIVSEWMGYFLLSENMLSSVLYARDKLLKEDGTLIPDSGTIFMAPITDKEYFDKTVGYWDTVSETYGVDMSCLKPMAQESLAKPLYRVIKPGSHIVAPYCKVFKLDLKSVKVEDLQNVKGPFEFTCPDQNTVHGFISWFDVSFNDEVFLSTSPYRPRTHWKHSVFYIGKPFNVEKGTKITGSLSLVPPFKDSRSLNVNVKYRLDYGEPESQSYVLDENFMSTDQGDYVGTMHG